MAEDVGMNDVVWSGWKAARDTLREFSKEDRGRSDVVVELGGNLLQNYSSKLGDEGGWVLIGILARFYCH